MGSCPMQVLLTLDGVEYHWISLTQDAEMKMQQTENMEPEREAPSSCSVLLKNRYYDYHYFWFQ